MLNERINNQLMKALILIDVQNEFSPTGKRPVPDHEKFIAAITNLVAEARSANTPIAWIKHFNKPNESPAFVPGTWGAELVNGLGPKPESKAESLFEKHVYGAFTGTPLGAWLDEQKITEVQIAGFYTHGCLSTTAREAIMRGLSVTIDPRTTGACAIENPSLGNQTAVEVSRSALIHLASMGAAII
jgi:nicotinamidase-related amidase